MDCDLSLILESMHIAFMQREALRFEAIFDDFAEFETFANDTDETDSDSSDSSYEDQEQSSYDDSQRLIAILKSDDDDLSDSDYEGN